MSVSVNSVMARLTYTVYLLNGAGPPFSAAVVMPLAEDFVRHATELLRLAAELRDVTARQLQPETTR